MVGALCTSQLPPDVSLQLCLVVGKIARSDFPREWPALMPALIETLGQAGAANDQGMLYQVVNCLHNVLKIQTSKRLLRDRLVFMDEVVPQMLMPVAQLWRGHTEGLVSRLGDEPSDELSNELQVPARPQPPTAPHSPPTASLDRIRSHPLTSDRARLQISILLDKCTLHLLCSGFRPGKLSASEAGEALQVWAMAVLSRCKAGRTCGLFQQPPAPALRPVAQPAG